MKKKDLKTESSQQTSASWNDSGTGGVVPGSHHSDLARLQTEGQMVGKSSEGFHTHKDADSTDTGLGNLTSPRSHSDQRLLQQALCSLSSGPKPSGTQALGHSQQPSLSSVASVPQGTLPHVGGFSLSGSLGALSLGASLGSPGSVPQANMALSGGALSGAPLGSFPSLSSLAHSQATPATPLQALPLSALGGVPSGVTSSNSLSVAPHAQTADLPTCLSSRPPSSSSPGVAPVSGFLGAFPSLSSLAHSSVSPGDPPTGQAAPSLLSAPLSGQLLAPGSAETGLSSLGTLGRKMELTAEELGNPLQPPAAVARPGAGERARPWHAASPSPAPGAAPLCRDVTKLQQASFPTAAALGDLTSHPESGLSSAGCGHLGAASLSQLAAPSLASSRDGSTPVAQSTLGTVSLSELARGGSGLASSRDSAYVIPTSPCDQVGLSGRAGPPSEPRSQAPRAVESSLARASRDLTRSNPITNLASGKLESPPGNSAGIPERLGDGGPLSLPRPTAPGKPGPSSPRVSVAARTERCGAAGGRRSGVAAAPSMFAWTLACRVSGRAHLDPRFPRAGQEAGLSSAGWGLESSIKPFDFSTPSPDDVVVSRQRAAFSGKMR